MGFENQQPRPKGTRYASENIFTFRGKSRGIKPTGGNKIAIVIKNDLMDWQKLNVTSFLASSIAIQFPETHGEKFVNASKSEYLPFIKQPILIYKADDQDQINRAFLRAKQRELNIGIFTNPLFATKNEAENHFEIAKSTDENQDLAGIIVYGNNRKVNKALDGLKFHE